ncbi:MAG: ABC transporter substrate-binding protein, partial [Kiloniellales bacterium]
MIAAFATTGLVSGAAAESVLRAKVHADLKNHDPIWTTAYITRNHGYMVYDTLFAMDADFNVQPQMA